MGSPTLLCPVSLVAAGWMLALFWGLLVRAQWPWISLGFLFALTVPPAVAFFATWKLVRSLPGGNGDVVAWCWVFATGVAFSNWAIAWRATRRSAGGGAPCGARWPIGILLCGNLLAGLVLVVVCQAVDSAARLQLSWLGDRAKAIALATSPAPASDAENAALLYRQAFSDYPPEGKYHAFGGIKPWMETLRRNEGEISIDGTDPVLAAELKSLEGLRTLLRRIAQCDRCVHLRPYADVRPMESIPECQWTQRYGYFVRLHAVRAIAVRDFASAAGDVDILMGLADHVLEDPFLVALYCGELYDQLAHRTLVELMEASPESVVGFEIRAGRDDRVRHSQSRAMWMEQAIILQRYASLARADSWMDWHRSMGDDSPKSLPETGLPVYRALAVRRETVRLPDRLMALSNLSIMPFRQATLVAGGFEESIADRYLLQHLRNENELEFRYLNTAVVASRMVANRRMARIALAIGRFENAMGRPPESLEVLSPRIAESASWMDPFSGRRFVYRTRQGDSSWQLYSTGPDLDDDGGSPVAGESVDGIADGDVVWNAKPVRKVEGK